MDFPDHFKLRELTVTNTGQTNVPSRTATQNLLFIANKLENIRSVLNKPIYINSGYRSPVVNALVGGSTSSYHMYGLAVDISIANYSVTQLPILFRAILDTMPVEFYPISRNAVHVAWSRSNPDFSNINL